jgi:tetratricopeptide (TPR) repeat protein
MTGFKVIPLSCLVLTAALAQPPKSAKPKPDEAKTKADAYYHYALGHLYAELAAQYNNRGDYFNKAIENYRLAIKADPDTPLLTDELSDLYIQSGRLREAEAEAEQILAQNPNDLNARRILARIYARLIGDNQQNRIDEKYLHKAIEQYQKITAKDPNDTDSWLMLGRLQKLAQNSPEAEKAYKKILERDPNNEDALTGLAMVYSDLGDAKQAAEMLRRAADKNPNSRSLAALAGAYEQMRDYALAAETLKRAIEVSHGDDTELRRALAQDLMLADQLDAALAQYEELAGEDPEDAQVQLRISQIYRQKRDFAKAREASEKAKKLEPNSLEIRYNDVNLLEAEGKTDEAIALLKDILDSTAKKSYSMAERGNRVVLLERLGAMYRASGNYQDALNTFQKIAEVDPDMASRGDVQMVETYRTAKDYAKAETLARESLAKHPDDRVVRSVYASVLADEGKFDAAIAEMQKLLGEPGKKDRDTLISLAQVYEKAKRFDDMSRTLDQAEKLSQTDDERETIYFLRGAMYERMKKYDEAEAQFRRVLEMNPDNSSALNYLGYMFADRNVRLEEALDLITKALNREPGNGAYLDSLGWVYFRMGKYTEAESNLKLALEKMANDPTVHDHLGDVYLKQGKVKDAIAQWEMSLKEWQTSTPAEQDPSDIAELHKKLESARVRLAKENSAGAVKP